MELGEDLVFCNHHEKYCEPIRWCQNQEKFEPVDSERETLLNHADFLKKYYRENE